MDHGVAVAAQHRGIDARQCAPAGEQISRCRTALRARSQLGDVGSASGDDQNLEDLATVDLLSGGRLNPGVSVGPPMRWDDVKAALYPGTAEVEDFSYERVERLLRMVRGEVVSPFQGTVGVEDSDRVQPHSAGLIDRLWYGGASLRSAEWAGAHGMNFLTSSVVKAEESVDFAEIQASHAEQLQAHAGFREVDEVAFALPFSFRHEDYVQILTDIAEHLGPAVGWQPAP